MTRRPVASVRNALLRQSRSETVSIVRLLPCEVTQLPPEILSTTRRALRDIRDAPLDAVSVLLVICFLGAVAAFAGAVVAEVLLAPLPLARSHEVVALRSAYRGDDSTSGSGTADANLIWSEEYAAIRERSDVLVDVSTYLCTQSAVDTRAREVVVDVCHVSPEYFDLVAVPPFLGSYPRADSNEAMISFDMMRDGFDHAGSVIGDSVVVGGNRYQVSGVWQPGLGVPTKKSAVWTSGSFEAATGVRWRAPVVGRRRADVNIRQAQDRLRAILVNATGVPASESNLEVLALSDVKTRAVSPFVSSISFLLFLVSTLAFSSVSSAVLLGTVRRERSRQVKVALGAHGYSVVCDDSLPTLLVIVVASCLGVYLGNTAWLAAKPWLPVQHADATVWPRLTAALVLTLSVGIVASVSPAWRAWRQANLSTRSLQSRAAGSGDKGQVFVRDAILATHVVSVGSLLVVSFAVSWSWMALLQRNAGIVVQGVAVLKITPGPSTDASVEARARLFESLRAEAEGTLGSSGIVGLLNVLPFTSANTYRSARRADVPFSQSGDVMAALRIVTPEYFSVLRVAALSGRVFSDADVHGSERVMLISDNLAVKLFGRESALGKSVRCYPEVCTVVGVVPAVRHSLFESPEMAMYVPLSQSSGIALSQSHVEASWLVMRGNTLNDAALRRVRDRLESSHVGIYVTQPAMLEGLVAEQLRPRMFAAAAMAILGFAGVALVSVAVYTVFSRALRDRAADITIRAALGASPRRLVKDVIGRLIVLVLASSVVGVAAGAYMLLYLGQASYPDASAETTVLKATLWAFVVLGVSTMLAVCRPCSQLWRTDVAGMLR